MTRKCPTALAIQEKWDTVRDEPRCRAMQKIKNPPSRRVLSSVILDQLLKPGLDLVALPIIVHNSNLGDPFEVG
jgi:hypothetical protein